ncbi:hypothetical protein Nocox_13755 [Nonomuraea coxensis DSM 45129]|uniref:DUF1445 domain-containing protein n=1 Tax=Nonomuraea coxensis DSM 45129 TaxID=1122611 RepID=A0ABX8TY26_9ACTN|nr:DUF1445 domain-containing protein [Nonomuraea coxensis]QYC40367.1 hypothetical protein Nocox_13755 [Nonomuraea coxensis DSM 45129]
MEDVAELSPAQARERFRAGGRAPTAGWCRGWTQANLIAVPAALRYDLLLFAHHNPGACPVLDVGEPGACSTALFGGDLRTAVEVSGRYPRVHGAPVHVGDPAGLGIGDLARPDFGDAVEVRDGEVPLFWACGVTPQAAATTAVAARRLPP